MARILTLDPEQARGLRKVLVWITKRRYGGAVPGIAKVLMPDLQVAIPVSWLYDYLHMRKSSPLSRLASLLSSWLVCWIVQQLLQCVRCCFRTAGRGEG